MEDDQSDKYQKAINNYNIVRTQIDIRGEDAIFDEDAAKRRGWSEVFASNNKQIKIAGKSTEEIINYINGNYMNLIDNPEELKIFKQVYLTDANDPEDVKELIMSEYGEISTLLNL